MQASTLLFLEFLSGWRNYVPSSARQTKAFTDMRRMLLGCSPCLLFRPMPIVSFSFFFVRSLQSRPLLLVGFVLDPRAHARDGDGNFSPLRGVRPLPGDAFGTYALDFLLRRLQFRAPDRTFRQHYMPIQRDVVEVTQAFTCTRCRRRTSSGRGARRGHRSPSSSSRSGSR